LAVVAAAAVVVVVAAAAVVEAAALLLLWLVVLVVPGAAGLGEEMPAITYMPAEATDSSSVTLNPASLNL
jgi:hypothetical protein